MKKTFFALVLISSLLLPVLAAAQDNGGVSNIWRNTSGGGCNLRGNTCNLCDMIVVATNITKFLLVIAIALAVIIILYGAVRMMVSGGSKDQLGIAKGIIFKAVIGLALVAGAWFIVDTIFQAFAKEEFKRWDVVDLSGWCDSGN